MKKNYLLLLLITGLFAFAPQEQPPSFSFISQGREFKLSANTVAYGRLTLAQEGERGVNIQLNEAFPIEPGKRYKLSGYFSELAIPSNNLTSIDLSALTQLVHLDCSRNQLKALDLSALTQLETLLCGHNELEALDLSGLRKITQLSCDNNNFSLMAGLCFPMHFK